MQDLCYFEDYEFLKRHRNILVLTLKHLEVDFPSENLDDLKKEVKLIQKEFKSINGLVKRFVKNYKKNFKFNNDFSKAINLALKNQDLLSEKIYLFIQVHNYGDILRKYYKTSSHTMAYFKREQTNLNLII